MRSGTLAFDRGKSREFYHRARESSRYAPASDEKPAQSAIMTAFCCSCPPMPTSMLQHPALSAAILLDYLWAALCMVGAAYFIFRA